MELPDGLTAKQRLYLVTGMVTERSALIEDVTRSFFRVLNGDPKLAVGQQSGAPIGRVLDECKARLKADSRLETIRLDASQLVGDVKSALDKRNDLVHKLWVTDEHLGLPRHRLLDELDAEPHVVSEGMDKARSAEDLADLVAVFDKLQRRVNHAKNVVIYYFGSWRHDESVLDDVYVRMSLAILRGKFDLKNDGLEIVFRDRKLAAELGAI
jgi:hypothetical protein